MGVEPMTYGFFEIYKAVALPLSYRGNHKPSPRSSRIKSLGTDSLRARDCSAHSGCGSD
jgi:hypothetical protein